MVKILSRLQCAKAQQLLFPLSLLLSFYYIVPFQCLWGKMSLTLITLSTLNALKMQLSVSKLLLKIFHTGPHLTPLLECNAADTHAHIHTKSCPTVTPRFHFTNMD